VGAFWKAVISCCISASDRLEVVGPGYTRRCGVYEFCNVRLQFRTCIGGVISAKVFWPVLQFPW